jgi:hypothetical protein
MNLAIEQFEAGSQFTEKEIVDIKWYRKFPVTVRTVQFPFGLAVTTGE